MMNATARADLPQGPKERRNGPRYGTAAGILRRRSVKIFRKTPAGSSATTAEITNGYGTTAGPRNPPEMPPRNAEKNAAGYLPYRMIRPGRRPKKPRFVRHIEKAKQIYTTTAKPKGTKPNRRGTRTQRAALA